MGFGFQYLTHAHDWPLNIGGKSFNAWFAYIPITFEMTVLFAAWGMTITFYTICGLWPGVKAKTLDDRITDDKFCVAFDVTGATEGDVDNLKGFFSQTKAAEVNVKTI